MELNGDILVAAPRLRVWEALNSPEVLTRCIPGCESMLATSPTERTARVAVKVGPVRARFTGHIRMLDMVDGESCSLQFEGSGGAAGMAKGHSSVVLSDEADGTRLRYTTQASVGGKLGQVGGRMIDAAAKQMADQFFTAFQAELASPAAATEARPAEGAAVQAEEAVPAPGDELARARDAATTTPPAAGPALSPRAPAPVPAPAAVHTGEGTRVLWFALGALSTGFGMWLARVLFA